MKRVKSLLTILLTAALLPLSAFRTPVRADTSALASSYNADVSYIAYASEVEDQAQTNYCWAYMADAVLEAYLAKTQGITQTDFSEADMINQLSSGAYAFSDLYTGGSYHQALAYWTRGSLYGPRLESNYGLTDYYVSETAELGSYDRANEQSKQIYIQNIKNLLVQYGAVGVSVYFSAEMRSLTTREGAYYYPQELSPGVNHGVTIVGWDDNYAPQWFYNGITTPQQPQRKGAFLVKNSWGRYDAASIGGNTGYYWISYDNYFQDAFAVTQVTDRSKLYSHIYETDYRGLYEYASGVSYSQQYRLSGGRQWFTGFATYVKAGASYRFYLNDQELTQFAGTMAQTGYHTFQLTNPVEVSGTIDLRVEVSSNEEAVPLACSAYSHEADGNNVCLKAFTKSVYSLPSQPGNWGTYPNPYPGYPNTNTSSVTGITLTPQECTVMQGTSQVFSAKVLGSGTVQPSQRVNWQLSGRSSLNTWISDNGVLYVGADESSSVLYIYASAYENSGHSASARVAVTKSGSANQTIGNTGTNNTGTNINGSVNGTPNQTGTSASNNGPAPNVTGTPVTKPPQNADKENINGSKADAGEEYVHVGTVGSGVYSFWKDGTAQFLKSTSNKRTSMNIPAKVKMDGQNYEVIVLDEGCMQNSRKLKSVTIGSNVTQICEDAFYGCGKLKKIKIKSEQLEYIGEDAFEGIPDHAVIYVPHSCLTEYRIMVRESGNRDVRVKAYN